ncbi:hypothetical protein [Planomonospora parontospora]|uniref:hypothetical protein n=1 Tax=Planomonospora parontospora TaxID=58119 RepID=UPI00199864EE|nr:hypothetical protein [Planomonospora parontospora]GGL21321.1 hypothetical protein GCM10014719_24240 [Planomonospora parontospora subsp. antibiotica]GII15798.1 hypothetical protein Ppa05_25240 [Planomonospora parontospora subsp. antibiotica]
MTVDDDPGVSRSVARDLRRRYGHAYRIVRADSAAQGIGSVREMRLRGDDVAVVLATTGCPG